MLKILPPLAICGSLLLIALMFAGTQAAGVTYYVSPTGNDKNLGTVDKPWKTIQKAANTVTAGNTVIVLPGTYNERVKFAATPSHSGASGVPVTFKSATPLAAVVTGGFDTRNANFLVIDGFKISATVKGGTGGGILVGSNNVLIANNYIFDVPDAAIRGYNSSTIIPSGTIIKNNLLIGNQFGVIAVGNRWLVEGNELTLNRWVTGDLDYIQFNGSDLTFRHNYLHGTSLTDKGTATVNGWQATVPSGKTFSNIEISGNLVEGFSEGVGLSGPVVNSFTNVYIFNNVFSGLFTDGITIGGYGVYAKKYVTNLDIKHNTFINLATAGVRVSNSSAALVQNNIFSKTANGYYLDTKGVITGGRNLLSVSTKTTFKDATDLLNPDPLFINQSNLLGADGQPFTADDGLSLQPSSPAINQALTSSINLDLTGAPRPSGLASDLGAYEAIYVKPDTIAPITSVTPVGGTYNTVQAVFFQTDEPAKSYYCFDSINSTSTCAAEILVAGALEIKESGTLHFYSIDDSGNKEDLKQQVYTVNLDTTPPVTSAYPPSGAYELNTSISFLRNEPGTTFYCLVASCTPTLPYNTALNLVSPLTLRFYSLDNYGNQELIKEETYTLTKATTETITEDTTTPITSTTSTSESNVEQLGLLSGNSTAEGLTALTSGGAGGGSSGFKNSATNTASGTSAGENTAGISDLSAKVVELQKVIINLLQQLIKKGRQVSDLATDSLAAVGSLFFNPFAL